MNTIATLASDVGDGVVAVTRVATPIGAMHVASIASGVCAAVFDDRRDALEPRLRRMLGPFFSVTPGDPFDAAGRLARYFAGTLDALGAVPLATAATPMQRRVWMLVKALPPGRSTTYATIADRLGMPRAQRAVGVCLATNPVPVFIPCHRVVAASGSVAGYPGGALRKRWLLRHEGALDVVDLTGARIRRSRRRALDPRETVDLVDLPRVVGY
jgi:methylated-DNA-[protein]-cysteine S-methyltransferase